jgi:hypothetical protein
MCRSGSEAEGERAQELGDSVLVLLMFRMPYERVVLGPRYALRLGDLQATDALQVEYTAAGRRWLHCTGCTIGSPAPSDSPNTGAAEGRGANMPTEDSLELLAVDDDPIIRLDMSYRLRRRGFTVFRAGSADQAIRIGEASVHSSGAERLAAPGLDGRPKTASRACRPLARPSPDVDLRVERAAGPRDAAGHAIPSQAGQPRKPGSCSAGASSGVSATCRRLYTPEGCSTFSGAVT